MLANQVLLLDSCGDAPIPPGHLLVATEVEWLRYTVLASRGQAAPAVVRGTVLERWASSWWEMAGGTCKKLTSPGELLRRALPSLSTPEAQILARQLQAEWGDGNWPSPLSLAAVLAVLFPEAAALWELEPSAEPSTLTAATVQWLAWLLTSEPLPATAEQVLRVWVSHWQAETPAAGELLPLSANTGQELLRAWCGLPGPSISYPQHQALGLLDECPYALPAEWIMEAKQAWEDELRAQVAAVPADTEAGLIVATWWGQTRAAIHHAALVPVALDIVLRYLDEQPATLSEDLLRALRGSLPAAEYARLHKQLPPPEPSTLPTEPDAVLRWVTDEYLPYRTWQAEQPNNPSASLIARTHAVAFGEWLLATYPGQLAGAAHPFQQLYWAQHTRTRPQHANEIVIWVIADGLGWNDARLLARTVHEHSQGDIAAIQATPCFGLLPTITRFTKAAIRAGVPYQQMRARQAQSDADAAADVRDHQDPVSRARQLQGGQMLVWRPLQPDKAYHETGEVSVVRRSVQAELRKLAETIVEITRAVPRAHGLRVLLTTDHGRMLGPGSREVTVPEGFEAHGRVTYREQPGPPPAASEDIIWLDPTTWFNLPCWVGVVRDERSFRVRRADGSQAGGPDNFSHGGIWPEEVVVPWLSLARNVVPTRLSGSASGHSRVGATGPVTLQLNHHGDHAVQARRFVLSWPGGTVIELPVEGDLPGKQNTTRTLSLPDWPTGQRIGAAEVSVVIEQADGQELTFSLTNQLTTDEFQTQGADLLGDL
ncbi:hypothetical protein [Hymenobacter psychrophilus]|uniref:PglZ domain-containing protein n=1 Tax=Hymenobacter psychrophilus TaxID=651662 RepID=A0A1H3IPZ9_9BACT|nr:hypothetical protein [Hymenobacter psychrophilus]SDY29856.1 hypothetical protein SAMN04488069_107112 [Hymenobacter psychrophilus]